ncbi:MAG TPA: DUF202 domain-containing protein [Acetobacteraceae bacterium]|nr:DUF202 domain-containing protein [Acetobacteraceae bacterium]
MIPHYSDHAANERTFLSWIRLGLAIVAFGFLIEKFNLFLASLAASGAVSPEVGSKLRRAMGPFGRLSGLALMALGIGLLLIAAMHYVRTARRIDSPETQSPGSTHGEVALSLILALLVSGICVFLAIG